MIADIIPKVAAMESDENREFYPRPSMAGPERCIRQMVYHGLGIRRQPLPGRALLVMDDSSWHEELTRDWIAKTVFKIHSQQMEVPARLPIRAGHIDGIITDITGVDRLLEHKALNHFTFQRFWGGGELPADYLTQTAIYIDGLQTVIPDIREGLLLIKNKNTAQYMEYLVDYDRDADSLTVINRMSSTGEFIKMGEVLPGIITTACEKFNLALDYIARKTLPKRQYDIDHWRCQYCQWAEPCWETYAAEFAELKTAAMLPNEVADMVRFYRELGGQITDMEKEKDKLKEQIKATMGEAGAREGRAGEYIIERKLVTASWIQEELIPPEILAAASVSSTYEKLNIKKAKGAS